MVRTQIQLAEEQARALKALSAKSGLSMAELIRRGVDLLLKSPGIVDEQRRRRALDVPSFPSEYTDLSVEHDRYLAEDYLA